MTDRDLDRAVSALHSIPNDLSGDDWLRPSIAAKAAGIPFDDWHAWCSGASNYKGEADCRVRWKSFDINGPIQAGTLFKAAGDNGWREGTGKPPRPAPARATRPPEPPPEPKLTTAQVTEIWNKLVPATSQHPYVLEKQLVGDVVKMLRVVPAGAVIDQQVKGYLAVPGFAPGGEIQTIQFTPPNGGLKLNLKNAAAVGAIFSVGPPDGSAVIVEGLGHASAAFASTGGRSISTFGSGNIRRVVQALRQREPDTCITIAPDRGKEDEAHKIASEFNCRVVCLPECEPGNFDINDLFLRDGFDTVQALLDAAVEPPKPEPLLKPVSIFDLFTNPSPPPEFAWDGYLPFGEVSLYGAHGGTGKSTVALMLAVCAALGRPLFGVDTVQSKVLFVSLEDSVRIVRNRLASICRAWLIDPEQLRDRLAVVDGTQNPELFSTDDRKAGDVTSSFVEMRNRVQTEGFDLVLIDNASDAFSGDEIVRRQVRAFIRSLKLMAQSANCAVVLLAHINAVSARAKKSESGQDFSGSTAWHNSVRSRLFMSRDDDGLLTLEHQKSNLGKLREPLTLAWLDGGFPQVVGDSGFDGSRQQGRGDDDRAIALLKLIAEFEGRGQYCSPGVTSIHHVHSVLKSDPDFQKLKLKQDDTKRIVTQCQRAGWIEPLEYRNANRKTCERWTVTTAGRAFAGLPAPTAPTAPTTEDGASLHMAQEGAPTAPTSLGGCGGRERAQDGAESEVCHA